MSFYETRILPYLVNVFMNTKATREDTPPPTSRGNASPQAGGIRH
jgi:hypothetical protein